MSRTRVLLLEDDPTEATLAEIALLFAGAEVVSEPKRAAVAVLGREALRAYPGDLGIPAVAILPEPTEEERSRARDRGVRAVYERPHTWPEYRTLVGRVLDEWLPARKA